MEGGFMKIVAVAALAALSLLLTGCAGSGNVAGSGPDLPSIGDQKGGRIPDGYNNVPAAMNTAREHCTKYSKKAVVTEMNPPSAGGAVVFQCL
jgi:predicted small secreted protein